MTMNNLGNYHSEKFALTAVKTKTVDRGSRTLWLLQSVAIGEPQQIGLDWMDVVNLRTFLEEVIDTERNPLIVVSVDSE